MIPYTTERRADTGVSNVTLGIWLFLASEVMLFGALFSSYVLLRTAAPDWPNGRDVLDVWSGVRSTVVLLLATGFIWRARRGGNATSSALRIGIVWALLFLVSKSLEWWHEVEAGLLPSTSTFFAMYYTLTGLHAAHVAGGILANLWVLVGTRRVSEAMTAGRMHALALYWVFVDIVWIAIFVLLYLT